MQLMSIPFSPSSSLLLATAMVAIAAVLVSSAAAASDTFVYVGCSPAKYPPATLYESSVDAVLTSILNGATYSAFNNFTSGAVHGLFQCRPDLAAGECAACVSHSVTQLGVLCADSVGAALQLDGCFVRYDNASFIGVEDKSVVVRRCGPQLEYGDTDQLTRRDSVLGYLASGRELFRVGGSGGVRGVAECVGDLTAGQCQDCLAEAIGRLKSDCGSASWGDVFLAKCYARFSFGATHASATPGPGPSKDDETDKTLAILIGLIAVVALITLFTAFLRKSCEEKGGK